MEFCSHQLENGLSIVAERSPDAHSLAMGFFVNAGSRDENDSIAGVSHFLEHMVFKGTANRTAEDVNREFDEIGAHYNAYTSEENTVYYGSLLPEFQEPCVDLLADLMRPSLREEDFEMEKKVIQEEIQMYLDQPPYGMDDHIKQKCFGDHAIARSVLGTAESVGALTATQMRDYFATRYGPSTITVAATGAVDFEKLVEQVERLCGGWPRTVAARDLSAAKCQDSFESIQHNASVQQYVLRLASGPDVSHDDRFAAKLLATIIGDDSGSRMYWDLVDSGLVESASLGHYDYQGVGMFYTWMSCDPGSIDANLVRLQDLLAKVQQEGVTETELEQAKNKVKSRLVIGSERPRSRLFSVGGDWLNRGEHRSTRDDLDSVSAVTVADVRRVLDTFPVDRGSIVCIGPVKVDEPSKATAPV